MAIVLKLGCWGRSHDGFVMCKGIENQIMDITSPSASNKKIADFLDSHYKLFDRPLYNNVHTALWNVQDRFSGIEGPVFAEFRRMEEFCIAHAKCGLFLRLDIVGE